MLKMIIVDDEKVIRDTISALIDWEALDIQVIGLCENGSEAYDMILDEYPDLVLTDIKMPGLSGLELIQRISDIGADTEFVILTGYGDYELTKYTIRYGIRYYLLKPCDESEITEVIKKAAHDCVVKRTQRARREKSTQMLNLLYETAGRRILADSLNGGMDADFIVETYEPFVDFFNTAYTLYTRSGETRLSAQELYDGLKQLPDYEPAYVLLLDNTVYAALQKHIAAAAQNTALFTGCGRVTLPGLMQVFGRLADLCVQSSTALLFESNRVYELKRDGKTGEKPTENAEPADSKDDPKSRIVEYVRANIASPDISLKSISQNYLYMNVDYISRKFIKTMGCKFSVFLADERIKKAKELLKGGKMSVAEVAGAIGCANNPQYFSQLFKKHTGMTPTEYTRQNG